MLYVPDGKRDTEEKENLSPVSGKGGQHPPAPVDKEMEARLIERKVRLSKIEVGRPVSIDESVLIIVVLMDNKERAQSSVIVASGIKGIVSESNSPVTSYDHGI